LGIDHEAAISRAETILLPALDAWRKERGKEGVPSQDCGSEFPIGAHVYFVRLGEIGRAIKIGFSNNLHQRFRTFRTATLEIEPLAFLPGNTKLERRLHSLFAPLHIQNEMFQEHYSIHDFIQIARDRSIKAAIRYEQQRQEWIQRAKESEARHQERIAQWIRDRDATHRSPAPAADNIVAEVEALARGGLVVRSSSALSRKALSAQIQQNSRQLPRPKGRGL
jgi:hypothetical protein